MQWLRAVAAWPWRSAVLGAEITVMGEGERGTGGTRVVVRLGWGKEKGVQSIQTRKYIIIVIIFVHIADCQYF